MPNRSVFDNSLNNLQQDILKMGSLVETAIAEAVLSLTEQDLDKAEKVLASDSLIDDLEKEIEDQCFLLIATQQPLAKDLRKIASALKIINNLERMGDYSCDIAKTVTRMAGDPLIKPLIDIPKMAELTQRMVNNAINSYVHEDLDMAESLSVQDDQVDQLHRKVFNDLTTLMISDPSTIKQSSYLLFVCRYLERIADHATNIGELVIFLVTGARKDLNN